MDGFYVVCDESSVRLKSRAADATADGQVLLMRYDALEGVTRLGVEFDEDTQSAYVTDSSELRDIAGWLNKIADEIESVSISRG